MQILLLLLRDSSDLLLIRSLVRESTSDSCNFSDPHLVVAAVPAPRETEAGGIFSRKRSECICFAGGKKK